MKKTWLALVGSALVMVSISTAGCNLRILSPGDAMQPPKNTKVENKVGNNSVETVVQQQLPPGAKLVTPAHPEGSAAIQYGDIDNDGKKEILATYKVGEAPGEAGAFILKHGTKIWETKGTGYEVDWASFQDINGDGKMDLVLGWTIGASAGNGLDVYSWEQGTVQKLFTTGSHKLEIEDMPDAKGSTDGRAEMAIWTRDTGDVYSVQVLRWNGKVLIEATDVYKYYYPKVVVYYQDRVKTTPDAAIYWYYLADAQIKSGLLQEAKISIEKGQQLSQSYPGNDKFNSLKKQLKENL